MGINKDSYVSVNSFYIPVRKPEYIRHINALYIDLDRHIENKKFTKREIESVMYFLEKEYFGVLVPHPSLIVSTGRGLQLYWLLENLPKQGMTLWTLIENEIINIFEDFKMHDLVVDDSCIDANRVLRLVGSRNTNSNTLANIYNLSNKRYRLDEIIEGYFPEYQIIKKKKKATTVITEKEKEVKHLYTIHNLHYARLCDIVKLQEIRKGYCRENGRLKVDGQREFICFLYRYYSCLFTRDPQKALEDTIEFNNRFASPLSETEVIKQTKSAEKAYEEWLKEKANGTYKRGGYNYTSKKLIKLLEITEDEQKQLTTLIDKKEKYDRNNKRRTPRNEKGLTKKQQELADFKIKVLDLKEQGLSLRKIADKLDITLGKVQRVLNSVSKNAL